MATLGVVKGGSTDDDDGMVVTWWRPREPSTRWSIAAACSAGGSGGMVELPAASGILELQAERRCDVAIDPLRLSAVDRVGQPGMATQSACMLTRTSSGTLGYLDGLFGPPWVIKGILGAFWMIGPHTHRPRGGSYIGRVAVACHQKLFSCGFLCCTIRNRLPPDHKPLTIMCHSLRKR